MQFKFLVSGILAGALVSAAAAQAQAQQPINVGAILQRHYDAAQQFLKNKNLKAADQQFRMFTADVLAELALSEVNLGEYAKAAPYFDGALALEPNSAQLRLDYARAAMTAGDLDHAKLLAEQLLEEEAGNPSGLAAAHEVLGRTLLKMNQDQEAKAELEAAMSLKPDFVDGYNLAIACLNLDDEKCAERLFSTMETTYGDTPQLHMQFGRAWARSDFQPRAEAEFRKVIAEDPKFPEVHYWLAAVYLEENEPAKIPLAIQQLHDELAITPNDYLSYAALGKLAVSRARYPEAEKYLAKAIELNPKSPDAYLYQGQMYYNLHNTAAAEDSLRKAIALTTDPTRNHYQIQKGYYLLGRLLMQQGKRREAAAEMKIAQAFMQTDLSHDKSQLSGFLGHGQPGMGAPKNSLTLKDSTPPPDPAAQQRLKAFEAQVTPALADSYNNLGAIAATNKEYSKATSYFQNAAEWNPAMPGLNYNWGRAAFAAGRFGDAIIPLSSYLKAHPKDQNMRAALGISQFMTRDYHGSAATLQAVGPAIDSMPQAAYVYANALIRSGQSGEAVAQLTALGKAHPHFPGVARAMGEACLAGGQKQKAVEELQIAVKQNPEDAQSHYDLGKALLATGNTSGAIPELESAVRLSPQDAEYHHELGHAYQLAGRKTDAARQNRVWQALDPGAATEATGAPATGARPD